MFQGALLHQLFAWDVVVLVGHAHGEAEVDLGVRIVVRGAELEHVAEAFGGAVFAGDAVVFVGDAAIMVSKQRPALPDGKQAHLPI